LRKKKLRDIHHKIHKVQLRMHNRKAKTNIPFLQAKLAALEKEADQVLKGNLGIPRKKLPPRPKVCAVCKGPISSKGYHVCKPGSWQQTRK